MTEGAKFSNWLLGLLGGIIGGTLGYFAFFELVRHELYGLMLPGSLLGLGCGLLSRFKSNALGIVCGVAAVLLALVAEWRFRPFRDDDSFAYFITHAHQLTSMTLVMIVVGALIAFWFGKGRERELGATQGNGSARRSLDR